jgi:predicted alpha/beta-hydrolase family hydrolase
MGGRVASMVADELHRGGTAAGLLCLGYPFHPPARPDQPRTRHLETLATPTLICQGARDPFGIREEVSSCRLSECIEILWLEDGDHDFRPRKSVTGLTLQDHLKAIAAAVVVWSARIST